jgi:hypothetical protein
MNIVVYFGEYTGEPHQLGELGERDVDHLLTGEKITAFTIMPDGEYAAQLIVRDGPQDGRGTWEIRMLKNHGVPRCSWGHPEPRLVLETEGAILTAKGLDHALLLSGAEHEFNFCIKRGTVDCKICRVIWLQFVYFPGTGQRPAIRILPLCLSNDC